MKNISELRKQALINFLKLDREEANKIEQNENIFSYYDEEYEILTDEEADERWEQELDRYLEECILPEIPEFCRNYFDDEKWKKDAKFDGRGHTISRYDGEENEVNIWNTWFYIYRQN